MAKVFVGNFSFSVTNDKLRDYFSRIGEVLSAKVMTEGEGGKSRGFGFVEFANADDAERAIAELHGSVWDGRVVKVCEERTSRGNVGASNQYGSGGNSNEGSEQDDVGRNAPMGHFRAQPLELGTRRKRKSDPYLEDVSVGVDYKDPKMLMRFVSERGRILPRRMTGLSAAHQREVSKAIKRCQYLALMPYVKDQ